MPKKFFAVGEQGGFIQSLARYLAFIGGVGSGKTASGAVKASMKIDQGLPGIIVAPDFPQLTKSTFPEFFKWAPMSRCRNAHLDHPWTKKKVLEFEIGGKIVPVYYGGIDDEDSWTGPSVNWVWFDEGGRKKTRRAFDILAGRIRVPPLPQIFVTTTPHGRNHWLYDVFVEGDFDEEALEVIREMGFDGPLVECFHGRTVDNRDNLDPVYYYSLMSLYDGRLRQQELDGEFITMEGLVWEALVLDEEFEDSNLSYDADYVPGVPVEWWVDDGFTKGHERVILMVQVIPPFIHIFDEYVAIAELGESSIKNAIDKGWPKPHVSYCDSAAAEFRNRLWQTDIDTVAATHSVMEGIKRTASWIRDGSGRRLLKIHPRCQFATRELASYVWKDDGSRPEKEFDNVADAIRYGLWLKDREEIITKGKYYENKVIEVARARQKERTQEARRVQDEGVLLSGQARNADVQAWYAAHWGGRGF